MTLIYARQQHRVTVFDLLHDTVVDGQLYMLEDNNNDVYGCSSCDHITEEWYPMTISTFNQNERKRPIQPSILLDQSEMDSIIKYVGDNAALLSCGVCQLLVSDHSGGWEEPQLGVICLIKDYENKIYSMTLLDTNTSEHPATILWFEALNRRFETAKEHSNLVTFSLERDIDHTYGLNFSDPDEAQQFHDAVINQKIEYMQRNLKKRVAPAPPSENNASLCPDAHEIQAGSMGVEINVQKLEKNKKEKRGILNRIFGKKKAKQAVHLDISEPTDFQHLQHLGTDSMPQEQQEVLHELVNAVKADPNNPEQMKYLKGVVMERHSDIRQSIRYPSRASRSDGSPYQDRLSKSRNSMMITKGNRGNTPRERKKNSANKRNEPSPLDRSPTPAPSDMGLDPLNPDWSAHTSYDAYDSDRLTPPSSSLDNAPPPSVYTNHRSAPPTPLTPPPEELCPPPPNRTVSRRTITRRNTPPNPMVFAPSFEDAPPLPRLPPRVDSRAASRTEHPRLSPTAPPSSVAPSAPSHHHSVPSAPPSSTVPTAPALSNIPSEQPKSSIPQAPPPPPPDFASSSVILRPSPPSSSPSSPSSSAPLAPPPPPSSLLSPSSNIPSISPDRRSFLDEIQNVNKSVLLRATEQRSPKGGDSPTEGHGDLLDSIKKKIESMKPFTEGSSDDDSGSDDSDDDWSD